jgi:lipopolysaccharide transport system permease protein
MATSCSGSQELCERTYSPEPLLGSPLKLVKDLGADLLTGRELAWRLFMRDLSAQYRQTYFGYVWAFLPPLVASLTFIFLNSQGIVEIDTGSVPYAAFAMMGTLLWQVFVDAVTAPVQSLSAAKPMLAKINFPREAILLAGFYMVLFNFAVRMVLLVGVMLWWHVPVSGGLAFFPVALAGLLLSGTAIGLALAPIGTLYGDISKSIPIFAQFLMLLTPVVYPARTEGLAGILATWNPISPLIVTARETLSGQDLTLLLPFGIITFVSMLVTFAGLIAFRLAMPHLIARMGG